MKDLHLIIPFIFLIFFQFSHEIEESFCAGVTYFDGGSSEYTGLISMGATRSYDHPLNIFWGANHQIASFTQTSLSIRVSKLRSPSASGTDHQLNGWLHLKLRRPKKFGILAVWALTESRETIGQFVYLGAKPCKRNFVPEPNFYIPCSTTPVASPVNHNMLIFTFKYTPSTPDIELFWKADLSVCGKPEKFRFIFALENEKWHPYSKIKPFVPEYGKIKDLGPALYGTQWITPRFYGPASPIYDLRRFQSTCGVDWIYSPDPTWLRKVPEQDPGGHKELSLLEPEWYEDRWKQGSIEQPQVIDKRFVCKAKANGFTDFGGRCPIEMKGANKRNFWGDLTNPPKCPYNPLAFDSSELSSMKGPFNDFVNGKRKVQVNTKCSPCPPVPPAGTVIVEGTSRGVIQPWQDPSKYQVEGEGCRGRHEVDEQSFHKLGLCKNSNAGRSAEGVRVFHAITLLLCFMVILPISCFMARYLKGQIINSHDTGEVTLPKRTWYINHILMTLPLICMFVSGSASILRQTGILGHSLSGPAKFHRLSGKIIMITVAFQCLIGFLRPLHLTWRRFWIYLHWFLGHLSNYYGVLLCILSYQIPASPSAFKNHLDPNFPKIGAHIGPCVIIAWLFIDLLFHLGFTIHRIKFDKIRMHAEVNWCHYFPVILPLRLDSYVSRHEEDVKKEDRFLHKVFIAYIFTCLVFYILAVASMVYLNVAEYQGFGGMECTHGENGQFTAGLQTGNSNLTDEELERRQISWSRFCDHLDWE